MRQEQALKVVEDAYTDYATYVNSTRALPSINDGLIHVQRRLMLTLAEINKPAKSHEVIGLCMAKYHPHGDSAMYGALVNLVMNEVPLLTGQGNFGCDGIEPYGPASMRYTGVRVNDIGNIFISHKKYAPTFENELNYKEQTYLPTPIPYALLTGSYGIGVGIATRIPACSIASIINYINTGKGLISPSTKNGELVVSDDQLELFNVIGHCSVKFNAIARLEHDTEDNNRQVVVVTGFPKYVSPSRLITLLKTEIDEDLVYVREDSTDTLKFVVGRHHRVKRIDDSTLLEKVKNGLSKNIGFRCNISDNGISKTITPKAWIDHTIRLAEKAYGSKISEVIKSAETEIKFHQVKSQLAKLLVDNTDKSTICSSLQLTDEEFEGFTSRSIKSLTSTKEVSNERLKGIIDQQTADLDNIRKSVTNKELKLIQKVINA